MGEVVYGLSQRRINAAAWPQSRIWEPPQVVIGPALRRLHRLAAVVPTPCQERPADCWSEDRETRESAARRCHECVLLGECRAVLDEGVPPFTGAVMAGVWTGPGKPGPRPKTPQRRIEELSRLPLSRDMYDPERERAQDRLRGAKRARREAEAAAARAADDPQARADLARYRPRHPWRHGTPAGYERHRRAGQPPCDDCAQGYREYRYRTEQARLARDPEGVRARNLQAVRRYQARKRAEARAGKQEANT